MICYEKGDCLKGKRVVVVFQKKSKFTIFHGSGRDKAIAVNFRGNENNPVVCTLEQSYHKKI